MNVCHTKSLHREDFHNFVMPDKSQKVLVDGQLSMNKLQIAIEVERMLVQPGAYGCLY